MTRDVNCSEGTKVLCKPQPQLPGQLVRCQGIGAALSIHKRHYSCVFHSDQYILVAQQKDKTFKPKVNREQFQLIDVETVLRRSHSAHRTSLAEEEHSQVDVQLPQIQDEAYAPPPFFG